MATNVLVSGSEEQTMHGVQEIITSAPSVCFAPDEAKHQRKDECLVPSSNFRGAGLSGNGKTNKWTLCEVQWKQNTAVHGALHAFQFVPGQRQYCKCSAQTYPVDLKHDAA
ncbi:hypothetical protein FBUS_04414 [Fasciolopsis buskii]|uniref:Uncharacterized protein n=1 Tax=Fasciolopsis buskii TaxID=27845 RepID=A0A8E0VDU8_9TREM|nr:hypothetical protein FBUS_04414 [Fasciolopsis buski]